MESLRPTEVGAGGFVGHDYDQVVGGTGELEKSTHRISSYSQHGFFKLQWNKLKLCQKVGRVILMIKLGCMEA